MSRLSPPSFPAVYRDHYGRIRRAIERSGVPARHRDDVIQDALLRIHEALPRYEQGHNLTSWLLRIAHFSAADHLRSPEHREQPTAEIDLVDEQTEKQTPERQAEAREAEQAFCDAASILPEQQRVVFLMHEIDELTLPDIAEALDIPLGTAASRLLRARKGFDAALGRRRAIEERKLGSAAMLPFFLSSSEALIDAGRVMPEVSPEEAARMWGRLARATAKGAAAGALSTLSALTPRQIGFALALAAATGLLTGVAAMAAMAATTTEPLPGAHTGAEGTATVVAPHDAIDEAPESAAASASTEPPLVADGGTLRAGEPAPASRAERALLDRARASLQRGDPEAALREIERHAKQFPAGVHAVERESMREQAAALLREGADRR